MAALTNHNLKRPEPQALAGTLEKLAARFGNRLITSLAVREQHGHTTTWLPNQPPDAVVMAQETPDIQDAVRICANHGVPVIAFGTGTSLEGHINAPAGGVCIDLRDMNRVLEVHADDLDCVIEPGVTRKALNEHLRDQGVFFPIDPGADASLGGMASTRASGTNAVRYGTMRENVLALEGRARRRRDHHDRHARQEIFRWLRPNASLCWRRGDARHHQRTHHQAARHP